jgi:ribonucleoside-diphosphate reductase beta chain
MLINPIFNPQGDDNVQSRTVWGGNVTNLMQLNDVRYLWANGLYNQMRENFWIPQRIDVTQDIVDYQNLLPAERRAFNGILSYLTFLDSVQTCNIPHLKSNITAPEIAMCMTEQASQEAMHNQSYQVIIESIIPSEERNNVYYFWRDDKKLFDRCSYIAKLYQGYLDNPNPESYFIALLADYLLEGIYFYNGFIFFYNLASRQLLAGSSDMFKLINRDELSHVRLYQELVKEGLSVFPHSKNQVYELFNAAVTQECAWTNHIIGNDVLGITDKSTESYTKYLANIRLKAIGLDYLYPQSEASNPYRHLENLSDTKGEGYVKANFFEAGVTSYNMSSAVSGWEEI